MLHIPVLQMGEATEGELRGCRISILHGDEISDDRLIPGVGEEGHVVPGSPAKQSC